MELFWDEFDNNKLAFQIHRKRNQRLKYLNNGSSHTPSTYKAIPQGVCQRLTKLTTVSDDNKDRKLDDIYPDHFEALNKAKLLRNLEIPTLGDSKAAMEAEPIGEEAEAIERRKKRRARDRLRSLFFCVGYTDIWPDPIHVTLNRIKKRHLSLCWLRITMSYHRFTNLREMFQGDMSAKLLAGITSRDFKDLDCNCRDKNCKIVIYEAERLKTGMKYLGNTQQFMKKRIQTHMTETRKLYWQGIISDSFASHFAKQIPDKTIRDEIKFDMKVRIKWQLSLIHI